MRMISILVVALISIGAYFYFLKNSSPEPGATVTQSISTTGVEMDLTSIAQAERLYFAQNGRYAGFDELASTGALNVTSTGRDGYSYAVEASATGFTVAARHTDANGSATNGAVPPHYPAFTIDQNMQVHRID